MDSRSGKRKRSSDFGDRNRRRNQQFGGDQEQVFPTPDDTTYRILCPGVRIGSVIGRGGDIIKQLRRETHARIKVLESIPGVEERVVLIWSTPQDEEKQKQKEKEKEKGGRDNDDGEDIGGKMAGDYSAPESGSFLCPAQAALFKVHEKMVEDERTFSRRDEVDEEGKAISPKLTEVTARLLVPNNQIGCLLGKGGKIIEKMRNDSGAQIRISSKDTLPGCALPTDELVQISGDPVVVRRAMYEVSARIYESPLRDRPQGPGNAMPPPPMPHGGPLYPQGSGFPPVGHMYGPPNPSGPLGGLGPSPLPGYGHMDPISPWSMNAPSLSAYPSSGLPPLSRKDGLREEDFAIRLLCPNTRTGVVIGKAGNAIRILRDVTGARIRVEDVVPEAEERVIAISATEHYDDRSPVIEAALKLQVKMCDFGGDKERLITTRLLVPSKQIGCLLGKGGSVITEMRNKTTAGIKVLQKVDLPKCAQDTDELVQIMGAENIARQALIEVLTRLRNNVFRDQIGEIGIPGGLPSPPYNGPPMKGGFAPPPNFGSRPDMGYPGGMYSSYNGLGQQGGHYESSYSSIPPLQGTGSAYGGYSDLQSGPPYGSRLPGEGAGLNDLPMKNSSNKYVEVTIPGPAVSSVLGKGGKNLASIREISGAKLKILDPNPMTGDRVAEIFGTPEQTQAAESLLRAFIYSGSSSTGSSLQGMY